MKIIQNISVTEDVTMVTLETNPTDFAFTASIFERIAAEKINVDMIARRRPLEGNPRCPLPCPTRIWAGF